MLSRLRMLLGATALAIAVLFPTAAVASITHELPERSIKPMRGWGMVRAPESVRLVAVAVDVSHDAAKGQISLVVSGSAFGDLDRESKPHTSV